MKKLYAAALTAAFILSGCAVNTITINHYGDVAVDASGGVKEAAK